MRWLCLKCSEFAVTTSFKEVFQRDILIQASISFDLYKGRNICMSELRFIHLLLIRQDRLTHVSMDNQLLQI